MGGVQTDFLRPFTCPIPRELFLSHVKNQITGRNILFRFYFCCQLKKRHLIVVGDCPRRPRYVNNAQQSKCTELCPSILLNIFGQKSAIKKCFVDSKSREIKRLIVRKLKNTFFKDTNLYFSKLSHIFHANFNRIILNFIFHKKFKIQE